MIKNSNFFLIVYSVFLTGISTLIAQQPQATLYGSGGSSVLMSSQTLESIEDYEPNPVNMKFSKYGGWKAHRTKGTGFFRVEKIDGRWWAIDPEGYYFIHKALNSVRVDRVGIDGAHDLLDDNGFNGMGNWSMEQVLDSNLDKQKPLAYCPRLSFMAEYRRQRDTRIEMPVFDDEFKAFCVEAAKRFERYKNDPQVFGYFSDNELPWKGEGLPAHLELPDRSDKNYITAINFLESRGKNANNWNLADHHAYMALMAERYYSIVSAAIKAVDPNHMYIGTRCNSEEKTVEAFMRNAGKYVDIFSNNHYSKWGAREFEVQNMAEWSGRPLMMTEFYGMEVGPDFPSIGAGWKMKTQGSRGLFYQNFLSTLAETGVVVGFHWFKFHDDNNGNKGVVNRAAARQGTVLGYMKEMNNHLYDYIDYFDSKPGPNTIITPQEDAYYHGNTNFNDEELVAKDSGRQAYIKFDVSAITGAIDFAEIKLFTINGGSEISQYQAELVTNDSWKESTITQANSPNGSKVLKKWRDGGDISIEVTKEVLDALDSNNKLSIRIRSTLSNNKGARFGSSEHPNLRIRPKLLVYGKNGHSSNGKLVHITKRNAPDFAIDGGLGGANQQNVSLSAANSSDPGQLWLEIDKGGGHFAYEKYGTPYSIGGGNGGATNQNVKLWNNADAQNQQWKKVAVGDGSYKLIKRNKNAFAINGGGGGKEGQNISLWNSASTSQNLQWYVNRLVHITKRNAAGFAMDGGNGGANRQNVSLSATDTSDPGQIWIEIDRGNGFYSYVKYGTNYSLDAGNGGANTQTVYLWRTNPTRLNQQWQKKSMGDGSYKLIKRNASTFAINGGAGGRNGQDINLFSSGSTSQNLQWFITPITTNVSLTTKASPSNKAISQTNSELSNVVLYPNPATTTITIQNAANSIITIYDIKGSVVRNATILKDTEIINLKTLKTGVYYAKIYSKTTSSTLKILKK